MFHQGSILYIHDFDFSTVNPNLNILECLRNKYIVILQVENYATMVGCFTTTLRNHNLLHRNALPGCNDKLLFPKNIFHFDPNVETLCEDCQFVFPDLTYIVGVEGQVFNLDLPVLYTNYKLEGRIEYQGTLLTETLIDILHCLHLSKPLSQEWKDLFFDLGDQLTIEKQRKDSSEDE